MEATSTLIVLRELQGNMPPELNAIQALLEPHTEAIVLFWKLVWVITAIVVVWIYVRELRAHRGR